MRQEFNIKFREKILSWFTRERPWFLKRIANYFFWIFIVAGVFGIFFSIFINQSDIENPGFLGVMGLAGASLIALPSFIFFKTWVGKIYNIYLIVVLESLITFFLILNALGALGLYRLGIGYDSFIHFLNGGIFISVLVFLLGYIIMEIYWLKANKAILFWVAIALTFIIGLLWEGFEALTDYFIGTSMAGDIFAQESYKYDTLKDIFYNTLGSFVGVSIASLYVERWLLGLKHQRNWYRFTAMIKEMKKRKNIMKNKNYEL